eukprot:g8039.t1
MNLNKQTLQPPTNLRKETINVLVGEIKKVRKHSSKLIFVTISILQRGGDDSINNTPLQLAIQPQNSKLLETSYRKQHKLLKPHVKIHASGIYGHTKTKTKTLFVTDFYVMKFLPGIHSSVLWLFLQVLEEKVIDVELGCSYVNETVSRMENILTLKKHDKKKWCSTKAREISTGRARRGRAKAPVLTAENKMIMKKYETMVFMNEIILDTTFLDSTMHLGHADPTKNLKQFLSLPSKATSSTSNNNTSINNMGNINKRLEYAKFKKRPQVQTMIKIVKENIILKEEQVIIDVGGGRGDLGLALALSFPKQKVIVLEPNEPSLKTGEERAKELNIQNVEFICDKLENLDVVNIHKNESLRPLIVGLHCCGGLSDAILHLCGQKKISFCIVTCCFNSYHELRPPVVKLCDSNDEFMTLARIAETNDFKDIGIQYHATRIINNLRILKHIKTADNEISAKLPLQSLAWTAIKMYRFPRQWSKRNYVLCGVF